MNVEPMKLIIENYRAIQDAEISLNGLTVVSGVNGCGKSTISKMLFSIFTISNDFYPIARLNNLSKLKEYYDLFNFILNGMQLAALQIFSENQLSNNSKKNELDALGENLKTILINKKFSKEDEENLKSDISQVINKLLSLSLEIINNSKDRNPWSNLVHFTLKQKAKEFGIRSNKNLNNSDYFKYFFEKATSDIINIISTIFEEAFITRPKKYFLDNLPSLFHTSEIPSKLELHENGRKIIGEDQNILEPFYVKNVIYLNTPMALQSVNPNHEYWQELNSLLIKKVDKDTLIPQENKSLCEEIIKVIGGDINISSKRITFSKRNDSLKLDLIDCATGIQSLSIIYTLLNNNSINNKTLLILDEPEAHLHPQWIVELARILVLLRKKIGCHIFISTHSTDMVRGIKYLSKKERIEDNVNFFIAQSLETNGRYCYKDLKNNISDIFKCFNKSLSKIDGFLEQE